jgi:secreted trypsin-like serine protease
MALAPGSASAGGGAHVSVIGGWPATAREFPFMALIAAHEEGTEYRCSGTVVSPNIILTAAHCVLNEEKTEFLNPANVTVLTGTGNVSLPGTVSTVERLAIDPSYISSGTYGGWHDAGIIQLTGGVVAPAVKLATSEIWSAGTGAYMVGWGVTSPYQTGFSPEMQQGETVVQSKTLCQNEIGPHFHPVAELCTLDYPSYQSATCNGDSGGPLLMVRNREYVEIGITSFGTEEGCPTDSPRVDTRADVEAAWVSREIAAHPPPGAASPPLQLPTLTTSAAVHDTFNVTAPTAFAVTEPAARRSDAGSNGIGGQMTIGAR